MSIAKLHWIKRALKDQGKCGKCGDELPPGSAYIWWTTGFRSSFKQKRCTKPECSPRMSQRESRDKIAQVMAAQEDFDLSGAESLDEIKDAMQEVAGIAREMADEYHTAAQDANGNIFNEQANESGDRLDEVADELDSWEPSNTEPPGCDKHPENVQDGDGDETCDECADELDAWLTEVKDEANDAVSSMELP